MTPVCCCLIQVLNQSAFAVVLCVCPTSTYLLWIDPASCSYMWTFHQHKKEPFQRAIPHVGRYTLDRARFNGKPSISACGRQAGSGQRVMLKFFVQAAGFAHEREFYSRLHNKHQFAGALASKAVMCSAWRWRY